MRCSESHVGAASAGTLTPDLNTGNRAPARERYEQALDLHREIGNRHGEAAALTGLGEVEQLAGDHEQAAELCHRALALYRDIGDRHSEADALHRLGAVVNAAGDPDTANEQWQAALRIYRALQAPAADAVRDALGRVNGTPL